MSSFCLSAMILGVGSYLGPVVRLNVRIRSPRLLLWHTSVGGYRVAVAIVRRMILLFRVWNRTWMHVESEGGPSCYRPPKLHLICYFQSATHLIEWSWRCDGLGCRIWLG